MKIKVTDDFLKVRVGSPSTTAPYFQELAKDSIIEVDDDSVQDYNGETWYKDQANNFYESSAVVVIEDEPTYDTATHDGTSDLFDLSKRIKVANAGLPNGKGESITIAVLDSGIDTEFPSLASRINQQKSKNYQNDTSFYHHGTQVAGFLVANNQRLLGLCPSATLLDLRVANNNGNIINDAVMAALKDIHEWNDAPDDFFCDIINMSLNMDHDHPGFQTIIDNLTSQGVVILVSGTEGRNLNSIAQLNHVFPVGTFRSSHFSKLQNGEFYQELSVSYLNKGYESTSEHPFYEVFEDSSAYTAITSGLIAKFLSTQYLDKTSRQSAVRDFLKAISFSATNQQNSNPLTPYRS